MRARDQRFASLLDKWGLLLLNPPLHGLRAKDIWLPRRQRWVRLHAGSTHHGTSEGRAIDLAVATQDLLADLVIHNGVHCGGSESCAWPLCVEFEGGDHFLVTVSVSLGSSVDVESVWPVFPKAWHCADRWKSGLEQADGALRSLSELLRSAEAS